MKKILPLLFVIAIAHTATSQQPIFTSNPFPKTINVNGSASMEIVPDQIYVQVILQEYQKKGESKKDIEQIKTQFLDAVKAAGIPDSSLSIVSYSGSNSYYLFARKRRRNDELNAAITYQVVFSNSKQMDNLVEKLDEDATKSFSIKSVSHSKVTQFRKQLKIDAIKAARDKGVYLTEAIGEKLGEAITVNEPSEYDSPVYGENQRIYSQAVSNIAYSRDDSDSGSAVDFKKLKLRFEVSVTFALK
jgi:uncharacterized protein